MKQINYSSTKITENQQLSLLEQIPSKLFVKTAPSLLSKAKLDNISIVPASMLPFKGKIQSIANSYPEGSILICHSSDSNDRQRKVLASVELQMRQKGHGVTSLSSENIHQFLKN